MLQKKSKFQNAKCNARDIIRYINLIEYPKIKLETIKTPRGSVYLQTLIQNNLIRYLSIVTTYKVKAIATTL